MTMNQTTNPEARSVALDLWKSLDFGLGTESGFSFNLYAYKAARDVTAHVIPAPETRMDDQGRPLDLLAPTVWHALCLLLFLFVRTRIKDSSFENPQELDTVFGTQGLFRGQARAWNITPLLWRSPEYRENERRLEELSAFWQYWASPEHDFSFDLFGKIDSTGSTAAIAQHYGLPTSLVDFTFDPRIAIWFACSESESEPIADLPAGLRDCAVVYLTSFYKLISVSKLQIRLPHPAARRIYRQSGCFVDYGARPESIPAVLDFQQPWMWVQENCLRLFFPRDYPRDSSLQEIPHDWIYAPDPFFQESVGVAHKLDKDALLTRESSMAMIGLGVRSTPSWRVKDQLATNLIYTDEQFFDLVRPVESYLRIAGLVETRVGAKLDPFILGGISRTNFDAPKALQEVARFPYNHSAGVLWMAARIAESAKLLSDYVSIHAG